MKKIKKTIINVNSQYPIDAEKELLRILNDQFLKELIKELTKKEEKPIHLETVTPKNIKDEIIYRIIDKKTGDVVGSYNGRDDDFDFYSVDDARNANCHGVFKDKNKYQIAKYVLKYELLANECD